MNQKIFIKTFGCQMNEYDSNRIYDSVKKIGFQKTEKYEEANCYLFIQPDVVQLLVQIMAWSNLPAFDIGPVWIDLIPP